jgi:acyl carrier protein
MSEIELKLITLFKGTFKSLRTEADVLSASMASVWEWDSLNHMELMLLLDEEFGLNNLSPEDYVNLTSFHKILELLSSTK